MSTDVTNFDSNVKTKLDVRKVLSGSSHSGNQTFNDDVTISGDLSVLEQQLILQQTMLTLVIIY